MAKGQKAAPRSTWGNERKSTQNTWKKENRSVLGADLPKLEADSFRAICKKENISVSAALSQYVRAALEAGSLDIIRRDIPGTTDDDGTTAAGSCRDDDGRRDDIPDRKKIDPAFPQGDQASENDTHGTVDLPTANDTHGTVCRHPVSDTPGTVGKLDSLCNMTNNQIFPAE